MKSRDMHWALVAHRDQRDVNLSSLRMLVVADGSNPCKNWQSQHCPLLLSKCTLTDKTQGSNKSLEEILKLVPVCFCLRHLQGPSRPVTPSSTSSSLKV